MQIRPKARFENTLEGVRALLEIMQLDEIENIRVRRNLDARKATGVFEARMQLDKANHTATVEIRCVPFYTLAGEFEGYRGSISDITPHKAAENHAVFLAKHDELTGLPNRRAMNDEIPRPHASTAQAGLTAVIAGVDLDGFKAVNDN